MKPIIALQLYTLREQLSQDYPGVMKQLAEMGLSAVEPAGFPGTTPKEAKQIFSDLGMQVVSAHTALPIGENQNDVIETAKLFGYQRVITSTSPDRTKTETQVKQLCEEFNAANEIAQKNGLSLGLHNHWWEFLKIDDTYVYQILQKELSPEIFFELDTYWIQTAGVDPAEIVKQFGTRAPLIHVKDGPANLEKPHLPMVAVGEGALDFPSIVDAGLQTTEALIIEMDSCATDPIEAVRNSITYLINITETL